MFMENIRNAGKKHRVLMIVIVACLCVAMVIGFAAWGSMDTGNAGRNDAASQIVYYENYINELLNSADKDNTTNGQLGSAYGYLADVYSEAGDTEKADAAEKSSNQYYISYYEALAAEQRNAEGSNNALLAGYLEQLSQYYSATGETDKATAARTEALGYYETIYADYINTAKETAEKSPTDAAIWRTVGYYISNYASIKSEQGNAEAAKTSYKEASDYYAKALELLPAESAAADRAVYMIDKAACLNAAGESETAKPIYDEAVQLAPDNISVVQAYLSYVMSSEGIDAAYEKLPLYKDNFKEGDAKTTFDNLSATITFYYQLIHSAQEGEGNTEGGETNTEEK